MFALFRLLVVGFVVLTVIYIALSVYSRRKACARLTEDWHDAGQPGTREDFVEAGLNDYDGSLRRKLILGVYVVPVMVVVTIIYLTNFH
ncbi:MAG: hypothetical protein N4A53_09650 [Pelagimonas sp.]|jgi:hypothetical protein|nr:hypothetical protein [Pelagimonas sp.]